MTNEKAKSELQEWLEHDVGGESKLVFLEYLWDDGNISKGDMLYEIQEAFLSAYNVGYTEGKKNK